MRRILVPLLFAIAWPALAADVYLFQAHAEGPPAFDASVGGSIYVEWDTDAYFFNTGNDEARVTLLDAHEGVVITIPAKHAAALSDALPPQTLSLVHADVPEGVVVEAALFVGSVPAGTRPIAPSYTYGKVRMPVFTQFTPSNQPQVHLATFLGNQQSHENVWIYNGGLQVAMANVEIRRQCDGGVVQETTVFINPKTSMSVSGLAADFDGCRLPQPARNWSAGALYTIVTVDQPSLSFVSTVANEQIPRATVSVN